MQPDVYNSVGYRYAGAIIFFLVVQWLAVIGRIGVRTMIVRKFGWDDIFTIITLLLSSAFDAIFLALMYMTHGGVSDVNIPPQNLIPAINLILALVCTFVVGTACLKIACGLLLLRVLVRPWQVWTIYTAMLVTTLFSLYCFFFTLFECGDPSDFHTKVILNQCVSHSAVNGTTYTHSVLIALVDLLFAVLPIALIWSADMSRHSKISVVLVLSLGSLASVCTFVRIGYVHDIIRISADYFSTAQPLALLSGAELAIGVTCISICTFKPLFHRYLWKTGYYYGDQNDEYGEPDGARQIRDPFGSNASLEFQERRGSRGPFADTWPKPTPPLTSDLGPTQAVQTGGWPLPELKPQDAGTGSTTSPVTPISPFKHV